MRTCYGLVAGLAMLAVVGPLVARDLDPTADLSVTPAAGPWMICVASYTGDQAANLAHDLVVELRQKYHLTAYTLNRGAELRAQQEAELQRIREEAPGRRIKTVRIEDQYAILVGGYKDMEAAHKALTTIKSLPAPPDNLCYTSMTLSARPDQEGGTKTAMNPLKTAFVVRNPTVPLPAQSAKTGPDPDLKKYNRNESFSLLSNCPKPYTLVIAAFQGPSMVQAKSSGTVLGALTGGGEQLAVSALNAHNLAEVLHRDRMETYVLHTRYYSVVTVGSFSTLPTPSQIEAMQRDLSRRMGMAGGNIKLLEKPVPMEVPHS